MTLKEVRRSPFRKALKHFQEVRLIVWIGVGCFKILNKKYVYHNSRKESLLDGCTRLRGMNMETA